MTSNSNDDLRRATESLLPEDATLSAAEVTALLCQAGTDPAALHAAFAAKVPLQGCAAFQALLPAYRAATLPAARHALLEDHLHQCLDCRHALHPVPASSSATASRIRHGIPAWGWAAAAVIIAALLTWGARAGMLPGESQTLATVARSGAAVYAITGAQVKPVAAGYILASGAELRTGPAAGAALRLTGGTQLEMGRRTDVLLQRGWTGTTVHLLRGNLIVRATDHGWARRLYVETADSRTTDQGTVFSVAHGLMGSRVAVAQGQVAFHYEHNGQNYTQTVLAGHEATSNPHLASVPVRDAFVWSQNAGQYLAMLDELTNMGKQLASLPAPTPRYQSQLLSMVPADAIVYAAIPNLNQTLTQAHSILEGDLGKSPALQAWWNKSGKNGGPTNGQTVEAVLNRVQSVTDYLGDEIAIAGTRGSASGVVVLASVNKPGLKDALLNPGSTTAMPALTIVNNPASVATARTHGLLVWIGNGKLVATNNGALLQECAALASQSAPGPFLATPLYQKIAPLYQAGASWILAADLHHLLSHRPHARANATSAAGRPAFLVARSQLHSNGTPSYVQVDFSGPRAGLAAVLAAPGPMGGLQFISPDATLVVSFLTETPAQLVALLGHRHHASSTKPEAPAQQALNAELKNVVGLLGGEFTFAQDGPVLPTPSWKAVIEVNDSTALQSAIAALVNDRNAIAKSRHRIALAQQSADGQTIYTVSEDGKAAAYTFAGTYLLAGSSIAEVEDGLQTFHSGTGLPTSSLFQAQLPQDGHTNFSALFYHNIGTSLAPLTQKLLPSLSSTWRPEVEALLGNSTPGLTFAYAAPASIEVASTRGLLGLTLQDVLALQLHTATKAGLRK
ncbi:MAG: FecR domain-containing protein [Terriglobales bacterium]